MSGHSRWAQVKHKKAGADAKRSARFSKLGRLIAAAARENGPDPAANQKLRAAIEQARGAGLPKGNIERAIGRVGEAGASDALISRDYEAYGPGGSAYLIQTVTDNPNRTTAELRVILADFGGKLAEAGSVAWQFDRLSIIAFPAPPPTERDAVALALIDAGAADIDAVGGLIARVPPEATESFLEGAARRGLTPEHTQTALVPRSTIRLDAPSRARAEALTAALEDHPDVVTVTTNIQLGP